ncbi:hypothetical protein QJS66_00875 [Kocuria rhizophila]|nr:hypothetical protein QJS66_00875 [Kocuria rhizophila]
MKTYLSPQRGGPVVRPAGPSRLRSSRGLREDYRERRTWWCPGLRSAGSPRPSRRARSSRWWT